MVSLWDRSCLQYVQDILWIPAIWVIVCYLSKFVIARPLKTKTSREVLERLQEIYLSFGVPKTIQHDQGTEFSSKEFQIFHKKLGVDIRRTTAYHPQSNGLSRPTIKF